VHGKEGLEKLSGSSYRSTAFPKSSSLLSASFWGTRRKSYKYYYYYYYYYY